MKDQPIDACVQQLADLMQRVANATQGSGRMWVTIAQAVIDDGWSRTAVPVCRCGHSWSDHSDQGEHCLKCDCPQMVGC